MARIRAPGLPVHGLAACATSQSSARCAPARRDRAPAYPRSNRQNAGRRPAWLTAFAVATKVIDGRITSSFGLTPSSSNAACSAAVPLTIAMAWRTPVACGNHLLELLDIFAGGRNPAGIDAIEHQFPLARAEPRFVQRDRARRGSENGVDRIEHGARIERGARVGKAEGLVIASQIVDVLAIARQVLGLGEPGDRLLEPLAQALQRRQCGATSRAAFAPWRCRRRAGRLRCAPDAAARRPARSRSRRPSARRSSSRYRRSKSRSRCRY